MNYVTLAIFFLTGFASIASRTEEKPAKPVVVIELFTSQGCSSCPAADELLGEVKSRAEGGIETLALSYHVTYWNHLGWKDPYSSEQFTQRQKHYAEALRLQSIYTPQMIVNGEDEFVGSDKQTLKKALAKARNKISSYDISASVVRNGSEATLAYAIDKAPKDLLLNVAWVESSVQNKVPSGENSGRVLKHYNVVRSLQTVNASSQGEVKIKVPDRADMSLSSIIIYLQHQDQPGIETGIQIQIK